MSNKFALPEPPEKPHAKLEPGMAVTVYGHRARVLHRDAEYRNVWHVEFEDTGNPSSARGKWRYADSFIKVAQA